ncbi:MAG: thiamine-phosphate kinase [Pirellulaceae bacterium]
MEREFVQWLMSRVPASPSLRQGIGDDAAVLDFGDSRQLVVTTDLLADGVHFDASSTAWTRIGHKALAVNLSDLAAMAARPLAAFVSILLPNDHALEIAQRLVLGMQPLATRFQTTIAGGDTNCWHGKLVINVTAIGTSLAEGVLKRSTGGPGDIVLVTGSLGGSILGKHLDFVPRVDEAIKLVQRHNVTTGMDTTDGIVLDLNRMATASGCGAVLRLSDIPIADSAVTRSAESGRIPLEHALYDGEDFELLVAAPPEVARTILADEELGFPIAAVGELVIDQGMWQISVDGCRRPLDIRGYVHGELTE